MLIDPFGFFNNLFIIHDFGVEQPTLYVSTILHVETLQKSAELGILFQNWTSKAEKIAVAYLLLQFAEFGDFTKSPVHGGRALYDHDTL